jgi:hypothetical protein
LFYGSIKPENDTFGNLSLQKLIIRPATEKRQLPAPLPTLPGEKGVLSVASDSESLLSVLSALPRAPQ